MNKLDTLPAACSSPALNLVERQRSKPRSGFRLWCLRLAGIYSLLSVIGGLLLIGSSERTTNNDYAPAKVIAPVEATPVVEVFLQNIQFAPTTIEVKRGDMVEWKNNDLVAHTATAASFDSGLIAAGQSWRYKFTQAGNYPFVCSFHPQMKGLVIVK